jgi:hypothetical protein
MHRELSARYMRDGELTLIESRYPPPDLAARLNEDPCV